MNIGLTGGIATGKSTVSRLLVERGALLIDADQISREIVLPGSSVWAQIVQRFGSDILLEDGSLHRQRLGKLVFTNKASRIALNNITHPAIQEEISRQRVQYKRQFPDKLIVIDIPLLYESHLADIFTITVVVYAPRDIQLQRLMKRDGWTKSEAEQRLQAQWDIERKRELADLVIDNSSSMETTTRHIDRFWSEIHGRK